LLVYRLKCVLKALQVKHKYTMYVIFFTIHFEQNVIDSLVLVVNVFLVA